MANDSAGFSEMRFRKLIKQENRSFTLNADMYRLFFSLDEHMTMSQVAAQQQMDLALLADCISKLWSQGLIEPVGFTNLWADHNLVKLLKLILFYILGRKQIAYSCVDSELEKLGLTQERLPANRAPDLIAAISTKISDPEIRETFRELLVNLIPIRTKMKDALATTVGGQANGLSTRTRGKTRQIIDRVIASRSGGNPIVAKNMKTKLILKGIDPDAYDDDTFDNPNTLAKLRQMAAAMGVSLNDPTGSDDAMQASKGQTRNLILRIIRDRSKGNPVIAKNIRTKLFLKGIDVDRYGPDTPDNPVVLDRVKKLATTMGISA
jgi:hypothetical protein